MRAVMVLFNIDVGVEWGDKQRETETQEKGRDESYKGGERRDREQRNARACTLVTERQTD